MSTLKEVRFADSSYYGWSASRIQDRYRHVAAWMRGLVDNNTGHVIPEAPAKSVCCWRVWSRMRLLQ